jgi:hypothetical protein
LTGTTAVRAAGRAAAVAAVLALGAACGGGGSASRASGAGPASLPLPGAGTIPTSEVTAAASQMCGIVAQSRQSPGTVLQPFYAGPHDALHLLAAVAHAHHGAEADRLLSVMLTYESDIAAHPPPPQTGADAQVLLQAVDTALSALGVPAPAC